MTLRVKVLGEEGRWLIIEIQGLGLTTQVRKHRRPERQMEAIDTAVREAVYVALEWELTDDAYL